MINYTKNLNLKKPDGSEVYSVDDANGNMDLIDTAFGNLSAGSSSGLTPTIFEHTMGHGLELSKYAIGTANEITLYLKSAIKMTVSNGSGLYKYKFRIVGAGTIKAEPYTFYNYIFGYVVFPDTVKTPSAKNLEFFWNGTWTVPSNSYAFIAKATLSGTASNATLTLNWGMPWGGTGQVTSNTPLDFDIDVIV